MLGHEIAIVNQINFSDLEYWFETAARRPVALCTIYDAIPGFQKGALQGVAAFNDVILREAVAAGVPVIDLRVLCGEPGDYSDVSPIEPSAPSSPYHRRSAPGAANAWCVSRRCELT